MRLSDGSLPGAKRNQSNSDQSWIKVDSNKVHLQNVNFTTESISKDGKKIQTLRKREVGKYLSGIVRAKCR